MVPPDCPELPDNLHLSVPNSTVIVGVGADIFAMYHHRGGTINVTGKDGLEWFVEPEHKAVITKSGKIIATDSGKVRISARYSGVDSSSVEIEALHAPPPQPKPSTVPPQAVTTPVKRPPHKEAIRELTYRLRSWEMREQSLNREIAKARLEGDQQKLRRLKEKQIRMQIVVRQIILSDMDDLHAVFRKLTDEEMKKRSSLYREQSEAVLKQLEELDAEDIRTILSKPK